MHQKQQNRVRLITQISVAVNRGKQHWTNKKIILAKLKDCGFTLVPRSLSGGALKCRWSRFCLADAPGLVPAALWPAGHSAAAQWPLCLLSPPGEVMGSKAVSRSQDKPLDMLHQLQPTETLKKKKRASTE